MMTYAGKQFLSYLLPDKKEVLLSRMDWIEVITCYLHIRYNHDLDKYVHTYVISSSMITSLNKY